MVVAPVANVARHVHEWLLGEHLAIVPPPDLHGWRLVANFLDLLDVTAPAGEQLVGILAQAQRISESVELADLVEDRHHLMAVVMQGDGSGTPAEAGTDDDDYQARVVNKTCLTRMRDGVLLTPQGWIVGRWEPCVSRARALVLL